MRKQTLSLIAKLAAMALLSVIALHAQQQSASKNFTLQVQSQAADFQFSMFGYQWTTDSGAAPGPGTFSSAYVFPLATGIKLMLSGDVGSEVRTIDRFLYGTFQWTEVVPVQASGQITAGFLYYSNSITEIDVEQQGNHPDTFEFTNWVGVNQQQFSSICCFEPAAPHVAKLIWKPGEIDYSVDGRVAVHQQYIPTTPAYFIFNFWGTNSTDFGGLATPGTRYYVVSDFSYSPSY